MSRMPANPWDDITPIAPGDVMIHIGPPKTGSTSIQTTMADRRGELRELGTVYPGKGVRAKFSGWAVMGARPRGMREPRMAEWDKLVNEVNRSGLRAVVSSEAFARADDDAVGRIVASFGADRIHVVAIGRRLDKTLPSLYQEKVKKYLAKTYEEWLDEILAGDDLDSIRESFPPGQRLDAIVERWSRHIDPQRFHLICAPEGDRAMAPRSFERLLDLPEGFLEPGESLNESLDRTSVEMLRQLNEHKRQQQWPNWFYRKLIFDGAVEGLRLRSWGPGDEKVPTPPEWALERIRTLAEHVIASAAHAPARRDRRPGRPASGRGRGGPRQSARGGVRGLDGSRRRRAGGNRRLRLANRAGQGGPPPGRVRRRSPDLTR